MRRLLPLLSTALALATTSASTAAQQLLFEIDGTPTERVGRLVGLAGDVDRDGRADFLLSREGPGPRGAVEIRSGASGRLLRVLDVGFGRALDRGLDDLPGSQQGFFAGLGPAGDVDADGVADVLVGGLALSGATGRVLFRPSDDLLLSLAARALGLGDLDADGHDDVLVGRPGVAVQCRRNGATTVPLSRGWIGAYSGRSGAGIFGLAGGPLFGGAIGRLGDLDGDGLDDFGASAVIVTPCLVAASAPFLEARSSATGEVLWQMFAGAWALTRLSDLDGDGVPELATALAGGTQQVSFRSGRTGLALLEASGGSPGDSWGSVLDTLDDLDGDGSLDLAVGAPQPTQSFGEVSFPVGPGYATILSGRDGRELERLDGEESGDAFGSTLASLGDLDGDGRPELVVGAPGHVERAPAGGVYALGRVQVFSLGAPAVQALARVRRP